MHGAGGGSQNRGQSLQDFTFITASAIPVGKIPPGPRYHNRKNLLSNSSQVQSNVTFNADVSEDTEECSTAIEIPEVQQTTPGSIGPGSSSMVSIIQGQRDRYKQRLVQVNSIHF